MSNALRVWQQTECIHELEGVKMKLIIEIPEEFEIHFMQDKFEDFFIRIIGDMSRNVPSLCGVDEKEIAEMFKTAFLNIKRIGVC